MRALIGVGVPVAPVAAGTEEPRVYTFDFLRDCTKPKLFVSGARDQFGPRAKLEALVASVPEPKKLVVIEGADHFFEGRLRELREAIEGWVQEAIVEGTVDYSSCACPMQSIASRDSEFREMHESAREIFRQSAGRGLDRQRICAARSLRTRGLARPRRSL